MPQLIVEKGKDKGKSTLFSDGKDALVVGREKGSNLQLNDSMCSRKHFRVTANAGQFMVEDLGSSNGTLLNGRKIKGPEKIEIGDKIQAGDTIISFLGTGTADSVGSLTGQNIAGYLIEDRIGRGGMGTVYKALQVSLDRPVALKILAKELISDKNFINLFIKEARSAGQLNHPNIVQVYDVGNVSDTYYFSMEFVGGGSVEELLNKQGPLTVGQALPIIIDAAKGLEYAEKKQLVHRDIKPDNLMISDDHIVKIGDLGIAKSVKPDSAQKEEGISGSPHYIAPEQAQGLAVDHRADIYSLGCTFFQMLTGKTPYSGKSPKEIIIKHINDPTPSAQDANPDIPAIIANVIKKMMDKDPAKRFQSATDLIAELKQLQKKYPAESLTAKAKKTPAKVKLNKSDKWKLYAVIGGAAFVLILIVLFVFMLGGGPGKELQARFAAECTAFNEAEAAGEFDRTIEIGNRIVNQKEYQVPEFKKAVDEIGEKMKSLSTRMKTERKAENEKNAKAAYDVIIAAAGENPDLAKLEKLVADLDAFTARRDIAATDFSRTAAASLDSYRMKLAEMKDEKARREKQLADGRDAFENKKRALDMYVREKRFGEAVSNMQAFGDRQQLPELKEMSAGYINETKRKASEAFDAAVTSAKAACDERKYEEARRIVKQAAELFDLPEISERLKTELAAIDANESEKNKAEQEDLLKIDEAEYSRAMNAACVKIKELDLAAAKGKFSASKHMCKTEEFKKRMDDEAAAVDRISNSMQKIIAALNGASKNKIEFTLKINKGKIISADSTGITIRNNSDGSKPKFFWKDVSAEDFIRIGRGCSLDGEGRLGLGFFARFMGMDSEADEEFKAAVESNPALQSEVDKFKK